MQLRSTATKKIFISYRVQDTAGETGRLVDALKQHFTDDQIFMDIENLEPGADFTKAIERSLGTCDVFLAVIGPHWVGEKDGVPRINNPNDWVRLEVGTALRRDIRVVPVLVNGGTLPPSEQLPEDLQPLLLRQSIEISNKRWRYDTDQLLIFLVTKAGIPPRRAPLQSAPVVKKRKTWVYVAGGFVLCFVVLMIVGLSMQDEKKANQDTSQSASSEEISPKKNIPPARVDNDADNAVENISGTWEDVGLASMLQINQNGNYVNVQQLQLDGQVATIATGRIAGQNVELNLPNWDGQPAVAHLVLSDDRNTLNGTLVVQATGGSIQVRLIRQN